MVIWLIPKVPALWFCTLVTVMQTNSLLSYHFRCNMVGLTLSCPWLILWPCMTQTDLPGKAEGCLTCIHLWLWSHKAYLHNICASFSAAWETCAGASTGLALCVCACVCHCSRPTYTLPSSFEVLRHSSHTPQRPRWAQVVFLSFSPHLAHFPPTRRAPAPQRWKQLLFVH